MLIDAPIVAVTVHPQRARVTRRGRAELPGGAVDVAVGPLPDALVEDSVRVSGRGSAAVRVVGVDVVWRDLVDVPDERVRAAEEALRAAEREIADLDGTDAGEAAREEMLQRLARTSGHRLAAGLADGTVDASRIGEIGAAVAAELAGVAARRAGTAERRARAEHARAAAQAELARLAGSGRRRRREAVVAVESDGAGEVELEIGYVVPGAGWSSAYDARLDDAGQVHLTWYGVVTQSTGEDWPPCALALSTARPASATTLPELEPWWIDLHRPLPPMPVPMAAAAHGTVPRAARAVTEFAADAVVLEAQPVADTAGVAATWRLPRPTAVPGDGAPHRTTVTTFATPARLDHLTAPALGPDVHVRATVVNTSGHVLLGGPVATFSGDAFVGTTRLGTTPPGEEVELALGLDDQVVVEREQVERTAQKARFGSSRRTVQGWTTIVTNRRATPARVTVRDRLPVSRAAEVGVVDVAVRPEPTSRDDLGRLEWVVEVPPGGRWEAGLRCGVEHPRDASVLGWG